MRSSFSTAEMGQLAIYGGPRAVRRRHRERWRQIRPRDLLKIALYGLRDISTETTGGGAIGQLERRFTDLTDTRYALTVNSGTAALHSAYFAVGVVPGSEVIVPTYTFFASAAPILMCGGSPVFCDIDPETLTADPADVERRITRKTRAICVVHLHGNPARMDKFAELCARYKLALIEDCSHAHGALYQGRPVGSWGDVGCFSLQANKVISGGELGIAVTNNPELFDRMLVLGHFNRTHTDQAANSFEIDSLSLGLKYRPHLYGVLLALGNLQRFPALNALRRRNYEILTQELEGCPALKPIRTYPDAVRSGPLHFALRFDPEYAGGWNRGAFLLAARAEGVPIDPDGLSLIGRRARLLHEAPLFTSTGPNLLRAFRRGEPPASPAPPGEFPGAEYLADKLLIMPAFAKVPADYVRQCARALRKVARAAASTVHATDVERVRVTAPHAEPQSILKRA